MVVPNTATWVTRAETTRHRTNDASTTYPPILFWPWGFELTGVNNHDSTLSPLSLELSHERNQRVDTLFRKRVVDRRAHSADGSVPFEPVEAGSGRFLDELFLELLGREAKGDVHQRSAFLIGCAAIKATPVDFAVQLRRLALVRDSNRPKT